MDKDSIIFDDVSFSDIIRDIYKNSKNKKEKIEILLDDLRLLVKTVNDAVLVVPLIKEYLEVAVKNDEQLVKIAAVLQRILDNGTNVKKIDELLSDEEKKQLLLKVTNAVNDIEQNIQNIQNR